MEKTHWKKVVSDPNYIGEGDFQEDEEKVVTIAKVNAKETVTTAEGKSQKAVVHFKEAGLKPMILNVARSKAITKVAGSPYFEDWPGVRIQLYIEEGIRAFGEIVNAVRVRPFKPTAAKEVKCEVCGNQITPLGKMDAGQLAAYTKGKYGKQMCAKCAQEAANALTANNTPETENPPQGEIKPESEAADGSDEG